MVEIGNYIRNEIVESYKLKDILANDKNFLEKIHQSSQIINEALDKNKLLICGNGGSAADAQHFAAEVVVKFEKTRKHLPAISLSSDSSVFTAAANDYGYENVFAVQVEGYGQAGDVFIGITTSGNSPNIINSFKKAKENGLKTILLLGKDGGQLADAQADCHIVIPSNETKRIQEVHILIIHIWCGLLDIFMTSQGS